MEDLPLRRGVISLYHDLPTAGHPGISNTMWAIAHDNWWPNMKQTMLDYIKGCTLCQSRKNNPTKTKTLLFPIPLDTYTLPFSPIALDFIIKLPLSNMYDTILTITDTFSKASIFSQPSDVIDLVPSCLVSVAQLLSPEFPPHHTLPKSGIWL